MTFTTRIEPRLVINTMRRILREQVVSHSMHPQVIKFIEDNELLATTRWPSYVVRITDAGREYISDHEDTEAEDE